MTWPTHAVAENAQPPLSGASSRERVGMRRWLMSVRHPLSRVLGDHLESGGQLEPKFRHVRLQVEGATRKSAPQAQVRITCCLQNPSLLRPPIYRDRHCPKCQGSTQADQLQARHGAAISSHREDGNNPYVFGARLHWIQLQILARFLHNHRILFPA